MSKGTKVRTVRIDDALWDAAQAKAAEQGENLSEIIRGALTEYVSTGLKRDTMTTGRKHADKTASIVASACNTKTS
ncbi:ribbon-helix-helix domain-containing protein [Paenarthrobacter sp. R1]|uniref:ribbon-helix-helix domain-containing protein n=1 Tax=Paenarthrobacter sp. R1 TaxID=3049085 RepID=UPI00332B8775